MRDAALDVMANTIDAKRQLYRIRHSTSSVSGDERAASHADLSNAVDAPWFIAGFDVAKADVAADIGVNELQADADLFA